MHSSRRPRRLNFCFPFTYHFTYPESKLGCLTSSNYTFVSVLFLIVTIGLFHTDSCLFHTGSCNNSLKNDLI